MQPKGDGVLTYIKIFLVFVYLHLPSNAGSHLPEESRTGIPTDSFTSPVNCNTTGESSAIAATEDGKNDGMFRATLPFVMKHLGMIECEGAEKATDFLHQIYGNEGNFNQSNYLCGPTCKGKCVSRPRDVGIPPSIYPFGCNCETDGCDDKGPIIAPLIKPSFKIVCNQDPHCTCVGMGPGQYTGYSCLWVNRKTLLPITYKASIPSPSNLPISPKAKPPVNNPSPFANFFPLRWCSCCPRVPILRND